MTAWPSNTLTSSITLTAPGAGVVLAAIVAPPEGVYKVTLIVTLTGTAETLQTNLRLRENNVVVVNEIPTISGVGPLTLSFDQIEVNAGGGNLNVTVTAAATAGAIYSTVLIATRIG